MIDGPGVPAGVTTAGMAENIDLARTFEQIAGTSAPSDGHSLLPLMSGAAPAGWRDAVLIEHHGPNVNRRLDPDAQNFEIGNPISYEAIRTPGFLYVEYRDGEREFYDLRTDPAELHNIAGSLSPTERATLHFELARLKNCHTGSSCWTAGHIAATP